MIKISNLTPDELTRRLTYAGFILVAYELVKSLIVNPIKLIYSNSTFGSGMPFKSYEHDVMSRHKNEFEACLLYLRDFMRAISSEDVLAIQGLRKHRNDLAHDFVKRLHEIKIEDFVPLLENVDKALFNLSKYRTYMETGADSEFQNKGIDWETIKGHEYLIFEEIVGKVKILNKQV